MKIQINILSLLLVLSVCIALFFFGKGIGLRQRDNQIQQLSQALQASQETKQSYQITIDSLTEYVNQIENVIIEDQDLIAYLEDDNERLKELNIKKANVIADLQATVAVINKELKSKDSVVIVKNICDSLEGSYMQLPVNLSYKDKWVYNNVSIDTSGLSLTDFGLYKTDVNIILGKQRSGFLKPSVDVTAVTVENPYLTITPEQVKVVRPKPKWYQTTLFKVGVGFGLGLLVN